MKDVTLKFYSKHIVIEEDYTPLPPYFMDKDSIINSLELVRDTFKRYEIFFYEKYEVETSSCLVNFKVGEYFQLCIENESHTFFINEEPGVDREVDMSFGINILDKVIEKVLS